MLQRAVLDGNWFKLLQKMCHSKLRTWHSKLVRTNIVNMMYKVQYVLRTHSMKCLTHLLIIPPQYIRIIFIFLVVRIQSLKNLRALLSIDLIWTLIFGKNYNHLMKINLVCLNLDRLIPGLINLWAWAEMATLLVYMMIICSYLVVSKEVNELMKF